MRFEVYVPVDAADGSRRWFLRTTFIPACAAAPWTCDGLELRRHLDWEHPVYRTPVIVCGPIADDRVEGLLATGFTACDPPRRPDDASA